jgi:ADP-heptose:LPS heptosyltransferase
VERFAEVAAGLGDVVITAGRGEGERAHAIAAEAGLGGDVVVGGDSDISFKDFVELIGDAGALVSGDTGVAHLAVSLATPSVTLFGPVSPALWGPPPRPEHIALWHPDPGGGLRPGDPRGAVPDERLLRISAGEVLDALVALGTLGALGAVHTGCVRPTSE